MFSVLKCSQTFLRGNVFHLSGYSTWENAITAAEKVVGYPTSFMNLRFWLSDEMSNVAFNMRKLIGTNHPLMHTAKGILFGDKETVQTRGLVVLLISKTGGAPITIRNFEYHPLDNTQQKNTEAVNGVLPTQRSLAEITEMIHTASILHNGVMNIKRTYENRKTPDQDMDNLMYGNKIALLSGDFLLAKASVGLAALENTYVVEKMASAISDLMEARFLVDTTIPLPDSDKDISIATWEKYAYKTSGCLYAKSCESALMLSGFQEAVSKLGFDFGYYFGLLRQIKADEDRMLSGDVPSLSICSKLSHEDIKYYKDLFSDKALHCLATFKPSEARSALESFVHALVRK